MTYSQKKGCLIYISRQTGSCKRPTAIVGVGLAELLALAHKSRFLRTGKTLPYLIATAVVAAAAAAAVAVAAAAAVDRRVLANLLMHGLAEAAAEEEGY